MFKTIRNWIIAIGAAFVFFGSTISALYQHTDTTHAIYSFINILFLSCIYGNARLNHDKNTRKPIINIRIFNNCDPKSRVKLEAIITAYLIFLTWVSASILMIKTIGFALLALATAADTIYHLHKVQNRK